MPFVSLSSLAPSSPSLLISPTLGSILSHYNTNLYPLACITCAFEFVFFWNFCTLFVPSFAVLRSLVPRHSHFVWKKLFPISCISRFVIRNQHSTLVFFVCCCFGFEKWLYPYPKTIFDKRAKKKIMNKINSKVKMRVECSNNFRCLLDYFMLFFFLVQSVSFLHMQSGTIFLFWVKSIPFDWLLITFLFSVSVLYFAVVYANRYRFHSNFAHLFRSDIENPKNRLIIYKNISNRICDCKYN